MIMCFHAYCEGGFTGLHVLEVEGSVLQFYYVWHIQPFHHFLYQGNVESVGLTFFVDE